MTVGLVLVSHVPALADGLRVLVAQMAPDVAVETAGGTDDGEIGTSFDRVVAALERAESGDGVLVLYDLGSALLTTQTALEVLDDDARQRVRIGEAPFVEGAVAAGARAQGGGDLDEVHAAAEGGGDAADPTPDATPNATADVTSDDSRALRATTELVNRVGLHARPASVLARSLEGIDAELRVGSPGTEGVNVRSVLSVITLGLTAGATVEYVATGPDAQVALDRALTVTRDRFGEAD